MILLLTASEIPITQPFERKPGNMDHVMIRPESTFNLYYHYKRLKAVPLTSAEARISTEQRQSVHISLLRATFP